MSRNVTRRKCLTCKDTFRPKRRDAKYCSASCRQRAHRARARLSDYEAAIEAARLWYWRLVAEYAVARGESAAIIVMEQSQLVDEEGHVYMGCEPGGWGGFGQQRKLVGQVKHSRPGWSGWGAEAAGAPFSVPPFSPPAKKAG